MLFRGGYGVPQPSGLRVSPEHMEWRTGSINGKKRAGGPGSGVRGPGRGPGPGARGPGPRAPGPGPFFFCHGYIRCATPYVRG